ncbi:LemA family protein [Pseudomonas aeruginosa]|nr:LemA family protein [Pseudomonas aeruginosa]ELD5772954.1 LemA family protein [Pseudomonas aeruginosa]ERW60467.1 hypothetical protein Q024_06587 [Pseudomonas aeruginosa BWHPSA011]ETV28697.1 hypothetical protein Q046_05614 [Pseudomonas aeruginosa BWHPSA041]ETV56037.1 hypothetical protein Q042_05446 [Pseudomonas aeruginosa BWHPSA037]MBA5210289.1 LemA family protein [Pseudomonas aeruginosa]
MSNAIIWTLGVGAVLALIVIGIYNGIIARANAAKRSWADVITYERGKAKVLGPITEMLAKYADYESGLLKKITSLREQLATLKDDTSADDLVKVQSAAAEVMKAVKLTVENYPDLKANQLYSQVMAEIADQQENVNGAVAIFNLNVELHNNGIEQFPGSLVNSLFNKRQPITPFNDTAAQAQFDYQPNL